MVRLDTRPGYRRRVPQRLFSRHRKEVVAHALGVLVDPVHLQRGALGPRATVATNLGLAVASAKYPAPCVLMRVSTFRLSKFSPGSPSRTGPL